VDDEPIRRRVKRALGDDEVDPALRSRVMASMPYDGEESRPRWQWAMGGLAVVLAVAVVAGLIVMRPHQQPTHPAAQETRGLAMTTQLDFKCSLPVTVYNTRAIISIPDGATTIEAVPGTQPGAKPIYPFTYAGGKWIPVAWRWLAPDGKSYGYTTNTTGVPGQGTSTAVFVHDIAGGKDRQVWTGDGNSSMLGWAQGGIYFTKQNYGPSSMSGPEVWVVDPASPAAAHRVGPNPPPATTSGSQNQFSQIGGGGVWSLSWNQVPQPTATGSISYGGPNIVMRMDLKDGTMSTWYTAPEGRAVAIMGMDAQGHPLLNVSIPPVKGAPPAPGATPDPSAFVYPPPPRVLLLTGPDQVLEIADGSNQSMRPVSVFGDAHGIWLTVPGSLWLYAKGSLKKVADVPAEQFPPPTPPPGAMTPPPGVSKVAPSTPPGFPTGPYVQVMAPCI
jgi:hypothetical protein